MTLTQSNQSRSTSINRLENYTLQLKTTMTLRLLSRLFPSSNFDSEWLHKNARKQTFNFEKVWLEYAGQPGGANTEHQWKITVNIKWAEELIEKYNRLLNESLSVVHVRNDRTFTWNNLTFLSEAEVKIAQALERKEILYFANPPCRIKNKQGNMVTKKPDFLIYYKGKARILEVDGTQHEESRASDYERDRIFDRQGLITTRFTASECFTKPDEVVEEFLGLFN